MTVLILVREESQASNDATAYTHRSTVISSRTRRWSKGSGGQSIRSPLYLKPISSKGQGCETQGVRETWYEYMVWRCALMLLRSTAQYSVKADTPGPQRD